MKPLGAWAAQGGTYEWRDEGEKRGKEQAQLVIDHVLCVGDANK